MRPATVDGMTRSLSSRELDVLWMITQGASNGEIALRMFLSVNTVKTHVRTAYGKIEVLRRTQASLWGVERRVSDLRRRAQPAA